MKYIDSSVSSLNYLFTVKDLFVDFNTRKLEVSRKQLKRKYPSGDKTKLICCKIFIYFLYLVILDLIRNNVTFVFPTRKKMVLGIQILEGKELLSNLKRSKNKLYDYIGSEYKMPQIKLFYDKKIYTSLTREVTFNYSITKEFFDNVNSGMTYG